MRMDMLLVNVRCYDDLTVIAERFSCKCPAYLMSKLGRDVVLCVERLNVVDSFNFAFSRFRNRFVKFISAELFVDQLHREVGALGVWYAVHSISVD